ncbi:MAG: hypothetical protein ACREAI_06035, partial [Nitrososphaera sp.]
MAATPVTIAIMFLPILLDAAYALSTPPSVRFKSAFEDLPGNAITTVRSDRPVVVGVSVYNEEYREVLYVMLIEVRDTEGVTHYLSWQSNMLAPFGGSRVQTYWLPDEPGSYVIRTFALTSLQ